MRKYVVITPNTDITLLERYVGVDFVGVDEGILVAHKNGVKLKMAISDFEKVSLNYVLSFMNKEDILRYSHENNQSRYEKIASFLAKKGAEEIVILAPLRGKLDHIYNLLVYLKNDKVKIYLQDSNNMIAYYGVGSHVITRQDYEKISIIPFPEAVITMEHVVNPIKKYKINFGQNRALPNQILERIAVLKVEEGGVLAALEK